MSNEHPDMHGSDMTMLSGEQLLEAGFREYPAHPPVDRYDALFQKRIRDANGTRYFINVKRYDQPDHTGWQVNINFGDGCAFHPKCAVEITAYSGVAEWTPEIIEAFAGELWTRLCPNYYERNDWT
jgi:hypothetical protein